MVNLYQYFFKKLDKKTISFHIENKSNVKPSGVPQCSDQFVKE